MSFDLVEPVVVDDSTLASTSVAITEAVWAVGTTYGLAAVARRAVDGIHRRYSSVQAANTGHVPETDDGAWWTDEGPVNAWKMFDGAIQSQTVAADQIVVEVELPAYAIATSLYVGNIDAVSLRIQVTDPLDGPVYDETFDLVSDLGITDYPAWFFSPPVRVRDKYVTDLGFYAGATVRVTLSAPGEDAKCGALILGFATALGGTQWAGQLGIRDYSVKAENEFGDLVVVERGYRKTFDATVVVLTVNIDQVTALLTDFRARAALFVGDPDFGAMAVYGYLQDWKLEVSGPRVSYLTLQLASLT